MVRSRALNPSKLCISFKCLKQFSMSKNLNSLKYEFLHIFRNFSFVVFTRILILLEFLLGEYNFEVDCIVIHDSKC